MGWSTLLGEPQLTGQIHPVGLRAHAIYQRECMRRKPGLCEAMCSSKGQLASTRGALITMNSKDLEGIGPGGSSRPPGSQTGSIIRRLRQKNHKFQVNLGYIMRPCLRNKSKLKSIVVLISVQAGGAARSS